MKNINQMSYTPPAQNAFNQNRDDAKKRTAASAVEYSFKGLSAIFPSSNKMTFATPEIMNDTKKQWARAYIERGIMTRDLIDNGLKAARAKSTGRFPTCGQFISWCLEEGNDSFERYIRREKLTDLAERLTAQEVGWQCRTQLNERDAKRLWNETYAGFRSDVACGRVKEVPKEKRITPEPTTGHLTQEQKDSKTLKNINDLIAQGYQPRGALKIEAIKRDLVNPDGSLKE